MRLAICCAEADRVQLAVPLRDALRAAGVEVEEEPALVSLNDRFQDVTQAAAGRTDRAVVIVTPDLMACTWPRRALNDAVAADAADAGRLVLVSSSIDVAELRRHSPAVARRILGDLGDVPACARAVVSSMPASAGSPADAGVSCATVNS